VERNKIASAFTFCTAAQQRVVAFVTGRPRLFLYILVSSSGRQANTLVLKKKKTHNTKLEEKGRKKPTKTPSKIN